MKKPVQVLVVIPISIISLFNLLPGEQAITQRVVAQKEMPLDNRYNNQFVNDVFKNNILLNLAYLSGRVTSPKINWEEVTKPFQYQFTLEPNKTFAYHEAVKDQYKNSLVKTTNAHFNGLEGFKTDGYLFGDGVCHLASLINWVAKDAGLSVEAPTNHNFANIPDVPKEYGVSIYSNPYSYGSSALQNLYITNNKAKPVAFKFEYKNNKVKVSIVELN